MVTVRNQIWLRSLKPFLKYDRFSILQDGGRPPSWILKILNFNGQSLLKVILGS